MGERVVGFVAAHGGRRVVRWSTVVAVVAIASIASFFALNARGSSLSITIDNGGSAAADAVQLAGQTYADAQTAIAAKVAGGTLTFPFSFQGAHVMHVTSAQMDVDPTDHALAFTGTVTLPAFAGGKTPGADQSFDFLIAAQWPDATSTAPKISLVVKSGSVPLSSLNALWGSAYGGVSFSDVQLAISNGATTLDPAHLPSIAAAFLGADTLEVTSGVSFRGALNVSGRIADALGYAGWGGPIDLEGTLAGSPELLFGSATDAMLGSLDLKATLGKSATAPAWLTDRSTTFELSLDSSHTAKLEAHDDVHVAIDGTTNEFKGDVSIASSGEISATLANVGALDGPFGLSHLASQLSNVQLGLTYDGTTLGGRLGFDVTLPGRPSSFTVDAALKTSSAGTSADLSIEGALDVADLATFASEAAGAAAPVTIPAADEFTIRNLTFSLDRTSDETIFSVGGKATVRSLLADAVFTLRKKTGESAKPLLGLKVSDPACDPGLICLANVLPSSALGDLASNLKVPALDLVATPSSFTSLAKSELTAPEEQFFTSVYGTLPDTVTFGGGLSLHTKFPVSALPKQVRDVFGWADTAQIELNGSLGGSATLSGVDGESADLTGLSLTATLPTATGTSFIPSWVSFTAPTTLGFSYAAGKVEGKLSTAAHIGLGSGFDSTIDASFTAGSGSPKVDLEATLAGWSHPFDIQWLDLTSSKLAIKAEFGSTTKVSAELSSDISVGGQPFSLLARLDMETATKATIRASYTGSTTLASMVGAFGGDLSSVASSLSSALGAVSVGPVGVTAQVGGAVSALQLDAHASFTTPTNRSVGATLLVSATSTGFTLGLKVDPSEIQSLSDLVNGAPDIPLKLPSAALVLSNRDATIVKAALTDAEFDFYKTLYGCDADATRSQCTAFSKLKVTTGLRLVAGIELPQTLTDTAAGIGIQASGNLLVEGQIPIFGGTTLALKVTLGNFHFDKQPDWYDHGSVSIEISEDGFKFAGDLGMRIRRQSPYDATNCPDGSVRQIVWNDASAGSACYDALDFVVAAGIDWSNPAAPGITLSGELQTDHGWRYAFGQPWLTINHVGLELGVKMTATGPEVTLGFQGDIVVGTKDFQGAIKVGLATLPGPPFVRPDLIGFSVASNSGVALSDLVALEQAVAGSSAPLDTSALPADVSIRNFYFQFSQQNDSTLCLTHGIHFNGDLYVGANLPAPDQPSTGGTGCRNFNADPNAPSASCLLHKANGCLASIGGSIDANGIRAKGELSGFTLGPIQMKDSSFHLTLTLLDQSLAMQGGVKIGTSSYTFADGSASLSFGRSGFFFTGDAAILNGAFHGYIQTSAPFDFSNPSFQLQVWLRADLNAAIQGAINGAIQTVKPLIVGLGSVWQLFGQGGGLTLLQNLPNTLASAGISVPPAIQTVIDGIASAASTISSYGHGGSLSSLDFLLKGFKLPDFPGIPSAYVPSSKTCIGTKVEGDTCWATPPWHTIWGDCCGIPGTWAYPTCLGFTTNGGCWVVPPITGPSIPGMCAAVGIPTTSADCSWEGLLNRFVLTPLIQKFNSVTGLNLPTTTTEIGNSINTLVNSLTAPNVNVFSLDCAEFKADASNLASGNVNVQLAAKMSVFGHQLQFGSGWNFATTPGGNAGSYVKEILRQLLSPSSATCDPIPPGHENVQLAAQKLNVSLQNGTVNEGGTVTFNGAFQNTSSSYPSVLVDWGDGNTTTIPAGTSRTLSATHTYANDGPSGLPTWQYAVSGTVQDSGSDTEASFATVNNVSPSITSLNVSAIDENGVATLTGAFTDPGVQDSHQLTVDWGDGSAPQTVTAAVGAYTFSVTHRYLDNPASGSSYAVTAQFADDDTGTADTTAQATVRNVAPSTIKVEPASVLADPKDNGNVVVREGAYVTYTVSFADPGTLDTHDVVVDWGDGTDASTVSLDAGVLTTTVAHQFVDNGRYGVQATVTDKDGAATTGTSQIDVLNVAPDVSFGLDQTHVVEGTTVTLQATIADPGALDSQSVTVDWGDGTTPDELHLAKDERAFRLTHDYADDNPTATASDVNHVVVTSTDKDGGVGTETSPITVDNVAPTVAVDYSTLRLDEGQSVSVHGTITDPGVQDSQDVLIDWGDGSTPTTIARSADRRTFDATHTYVDDNPTATPSDRYTIGTMVVDDDTGVGTTSQEVTVDNVAPVLTSIVVPSDVNEGSSFHVSGGIVDPGLADTQTVRIDWGDGTAPTVIERAADQRSFGADHTYVDENPTGTPMDPYGIYFTVTDDDTGETYHLSALIVHNVAPEVSFTLDRASLNESETLTIDGRITDPGVEDSQTVVVDWGDGTAPDTLERTAAQRTFVMSHAYLDDNPTATAVDVNHVHVTVTDDDTGVGTAVHDETVHNVAPTLAISLDRNRFDENNTVLLSGTITDPGVQDTNTVLIDWGPGRTNADEYQTLELPASQRTFTVTKAYGDDGTFPIHVTVTDDDTGVGTADTTLVVDNVSPTAAIDSAGAVYPQGVRTFITRAGQSTGFTARTTDPGSDDLLATWTWQDGSTTPTTWLAAPPTADPHPSPQVGPRDVLDDHHHTWTSPCLYTGVRFDSLDDDGGTASDDVVVVVTGTDGRQRGAGYWESQYAGRAGQSLGASTLDCYLRIAGFMSGVFGEARSLGSSSAAAAILHGSGPDEHDKLDRELLTTWLDFANGAIAYADFVDTITAAERVRVDPASTQAELRAQRQSLQRLNND